MKIIRNLEFQGKQTAVCIGKFDGIHRGHRLLIEQAKKENKPIVMISFSVDEAKVLYTPYEKEKLAEYLGIDCLLEIPLTKEFCSQTPEKFAKKLLCDTCDAASVIVGSVFRFGAGRSGDTDTLQQLGEKLGFSVTVLSKLELGGEVVSSTRIRSLIAKGKMEQANELLGTPYFLTGVVQKGNQLGRTMETPTANIYPDAHKVLPPYGVYAVFVDVEGKRYKGICNLGVKPTIPGENEVGFEVWLFNFSGDLYDKELTAYFVSFLREERKFASLTQLKEQITRDTVLAKQILSQKESEWHPESFLH